jgi:RNA polymerase sigma-70 factor (ECF subfamily)
MKPAADPARWCGLDLGWVYSDLLGSISHKTQCVHRARDVLHDSLLRFVLAQRADEIRQPHAYLRTVVGNVLSDQYREASRFQSLDEPGRAAGSAIERDGLLPRDAAPSAERLADLQQRLRSVQRILDCLPPRCREVFLLFRVDGCTQPEIAQRLGISLNMVERHVMRALVDLRNARELLSE